jgi:hypothetical protein
MVDGGRSRHHTDHFQHLARGRTLALLACANIAHNISEPSH